MNTAAVEEGCVCVCVCVWRGGGSDTSHGNILLQWSPSSVTIDIEMRRTSSHREDYVDIARRRYMVKPLPMAEDLRSKWALRWVTG